MGILLTFLGMANTPHRNEKVEKKVVNTPDHREEMKLAQLEAYMSADDNEGIANLSLYL